MTTHRRSWFLRAGAGVALVVATVVVATPAYAAGDIEVVGLAPNGFDLNPGEARDLVAQIHNKGNGSAVIVTVTAPALNGDVVVATAPSGCAGAGSTTVTCNITFGQDETKQLSFKIGAKSTVSVPVGDQRGGQGQVKAQLPVNGNDTKSYDVTLHGPNQAPVVPEVSGQVVDSTTGQPVKDATVGLQDGANHQFTAGSDAQGRFKFTSQTKPISPGTLTIGAAKDQYETVTQSKDVRAGQSLTNLRVVLKPTTASGAAAPTVDVSAPEQQATVANPGANIPVGKNSSGTSTFSWVLILLGALLVLAGIGAIALMLVRRKDDDEDGEDAEEQPRPRRGPGTAAAGAGRGMYHGDPGGDRTMVARSGAGASDATAIIRPPRPAVDEYPDPYAAPPRPNYPTSPSPSPGYSPAGGYGGTGYGATGGAGYGSTYGASPAGSQPGYGSPQPPGYTASAPRSGGGGYAGGGQPYPSAGYGSEQRDYSEPTGRHDAAGYRGASGSHSGGGGYGASNGYEPASYDRPGYDSADSYGAAGGTNGYSGGTNGYAGSGANGYGGYPSGSDYPATNGHDRGGYGGQQSDGYGGQGSGGYGYHEDADQAQSQPRYSGSPARGDRRLDWLDD